MTINLANGDYEYVVLCVDTSSDGWWNVIVMVHCQMKTL